MELSSFLQPGAVIQWNPEAELGEQSVVYKVVKLTGLPYRVFWVDDEGESQHCKVEYLYSTCIQAILYPTPEGLVQVWPEVNGAS